MRSAARTETRARPGSQTAGHADGGAMNQTEELVRTEISALIRDTARLRQRPIWQPVLAGIAIALLGFAAGAFLTWLS